MREKCKLGGLLLGIAVLASGLVSDSRLHAQVDTGTVVGTVRDEAGAGIEGAKVILKNEATSIIATTLTQRDGSYVFLAVRSGVYAVSAEVQDFAPASQTGIVVGIQQQVSVDFSLHGAKSERSASVPSAKSPARARDTSVGRVIDVTELDSLPVRNRNFTFLAQLSPGTVPRQGGPKGLASTGSFVANGVRAEQTNYLLDGVDINNHLSDFLTGNAFTVLPPLDAIQEFRIQGPNYSALLGRTAGSVLNVTTRSGSNQFHGSAWDYFGNEKLNAANFFTNAVSVDKESFHKNQFGVTVGGPIVLGSYDGRNRSFFFADYQGTSIRQGVPMVTTVPTSAQRNSGFTDFSDLLSAQTGCTGSTDLLGRTFGCGQIFDPATTRLVLQGGVDPVTGLTATNTGYVRDPFEGNILPASRLGAAAAGLLTLYPVANGSGIRNNYTTSAYRTVDARALDARVDHRFSDKNRVFARFSYYNDPQRQDGPFADVVDGGGYTQVADSENFVLSATNTASPTRVNEFRVGINRIHAGRVQPYANILNNIPSQYGIQAIPQVPGNGGLPTLLIGSLSQLGSSPSLYADDLSTTVQVTDNVTKIWRGHTIRAGGDLMHIRLSTMQPLYSRGQFSFSGNYTSVSDQLDPTTGIAQFLLTPTTATTLNGINYVGGPSQVLASNITNMNNRRNYLAGYVGDTWQFRPRLTVDLGVRWEYFEPLKDTYSAEANFNPGVYGEGAQYLIALARGEDELSSNFTDKLEANGIELLYVSRGNLVKTSKKNFAPRLGLAYQVTPKLVARLGYGFYFGGLSNQGTASNLSGNYPFQVNYAFNSPNSGNPIIYPAIAANATLEYGLVGVTLNPSSVNARRLVLRGIQQDYQTPYTQAINFSLERELDSRSTVKLAYVGSLGRHLEINPGLNEVSMLLPSRLDAQTYAPYPDFAYGSSYIATAGSSYYHSAQLSFTRKLAHGLTFYGDYTYSKTRTDALDLFDSNGGASYRAPYIDGFGVKGDYGLASFDVRHTLHFSGGYALPFGTGKRFLGGNSGIRGKILRDWNLNWVFTLRGGQPVTIPCTATTAAGVGCYALLVEGADPTAGTHSRGQYWNAAAFTNPEVATSAGQSDPTPLGGAPTQVLGPSLNQLDLALRRTFKSSEKTQLEFRVEAFNVFNHTNFALPTNLNFNDVAGFGQSTSTISTPRQIQFALKLYF